MFPPNAALSRSVVKKRVRAIGGLLVRNMFHLVPVMSRKTPLTLWNERQPASSEAAEMTPPLSSACIVLARAPVAHRRNRRR